MSVAQTYGSMNSPKDHFFCLIKKCFRLICLSLAEENVRCLPHNWALNLALAPSIVSIWLPGSPFDPFYLAKAVSTGSEAVVLSPSTNGSSATDVSLDDKCQYQPLTSVIVFLASIITGK